MHKYGFHVNRSGDDVFDAICRLKPKVVKTLEHDIGFWTRVREIHPDVFLIGRQYVTNDEQAQFVNDPTAKGRAFAERILNLEVNHVQVQGRPLFDAWESYNEVIPESVPADLKRKYDDFQVAFAGPLKAAGFEPIAMNFATGNMLGADFLSCFPGTLTTYRYLGFHEYDWPDLWRLHEQNIREKNEGGMFLALRYRRIMNEVRKVYPTQHIVLITECGMTQGVQGGNNDYGPWHPGSPISEQRYWDSLMWYNGELIQDNYVMGACLFVVGAVKPWQSFEHLGGIVNRLEQLQNGNPPPVLTRPALPETPMPTPGDDTLRTLLTTEAARRQLLHFNPQAALQKRIFADGFVPNTDEFTITADNAQYVAQQAEHLASGEKRVYYVKVGDWGNIQTIRNN